MCTCVQLAFGASQLASSPSADALPGWVAEPFGLAPERAPARRDLVLERVEVVNPGGGRVHDATVEVRDGRIARITHGHGGVGRPSRYLLPGLIDVHVHALPGLALETLGIPEKEAKQLAATGPSL